MTPFAQIVAGPVGVPAGQGFGIRHGVGHAAMAVASSGDASTWWIAFGCAAAVLAYLAMGIAKGVYVNAG